MLPLTPSAPAHLAPLFAKKCSSRCCWFSRLLVPMLLVRQVARPDVVGSAGCPSRRCLALRCEVASRCAVRRPCWQLLLDDAGAASAENLPRIGFRGAATSSAQTFASLHPSRSASLAGPSHSRGTWASTVCAEEFPTPLERSICQIVSVHWIAAAQTDANLSAHLHRLPTPPPYLRRMRLSPGRDAGVGLQMMRLLGRDAGVGCMIWLQLGRCGVPANHRAQESLF